MTNAATFLGGAKSRLLPVSVPFRFFVAAALFHVMLWVVLVVDGDQVIGFRGGLGPALAAVHLLTLGILTATAIGAAVQLLPVATRRALVAVWPIKLVFWLTVPGLTLLIAGMFVMNTTITVAGAVVATAGLLLFAGLLGDNLRRAGGLGAVAAYGWTALVSLIAVAALGTALSFNFEQGFLPDHGAAALAHMILGGFGFMGMLVLGFSHILVPMFALSASPDKRRAMTGFVLAAAAIVLGTAAALLGHRGLLTAAAVIGFGAVAIHLRLMQVALAKGMRKRLGLSFVLVRGAWLALPVTLVVGLAALYDVAGPNGPSLFGLFLLMGWQLTFLLGILQRIMPFLASMHVTLPKGSPPMLSDLAGHRPAQNACRLSCSGVRGSVLCDPARKRTGGARRRRGRPPRIAGLCRVHGGFGAAADGAEGLTAVQRCSDVLAGVDLKYFAGDRASGIRQQEQDRVADVGGIGEGAQRGFVGGLGEKSRAAARAPSRSSPCRERRR